MKKLADEIASFKAKNRYGTPDTMSAREWAEWFLEIHRFYTKVFLENKKRFYCPQTLHGILCPSGQKVCQRIEWEGMTGPDHVGEKTRMTLLLTVQRTSYLTKVVTMDEAGNVFLCEVSYKKAIPENEDRTPISTSLYCFVLVPSMIDLVRAIKLSTSEKLTLRNSGDTLIRNLHTMVTDSVEKLLSQESGKPFTFLTQSMHREITRYHLN